MTEETHTENGYEVEQTHHGQTRRYGGTSEEFTVKSDKPESEVLAYCTDHVYKCELSRKDWLAVERSDKSTMDTHFRASYSFRKVKDGEYFYQVEFPSTH